MAKTAKKIKENIKGMKGDELKTELARTQEELRALRFKSEGSKSKNVKEEATLRKQIAQIMTVMNAVK